VETTLHLHSAIEDHLDVVDAGPIHVGRQRIGDSLDAVVIRVGGPATGQLTILGSLARPSASLQSCRPSCTTSRRPGRDRPGEVAAGER
jgi:hypothetical protein